MILVTGGTGFLGGYIIKQLVAKGYAVRATRRESSKLPLFIPSDILQKVQWVDGDVLDIMSMEEAMEGVDAVIHAAAKVSFEPAEKSEMFSINIEGTANTVNIALEKNVRRFIYISSVAALGRTINGETVTEEREWQETSINTNYAISKYKAEMEVWRAMGEGLSAAILNPSTIIGYGDWDSSSCAIFKSIHQEFPYYTNGINGFVYVEDVARATLQLLESDITRERFIVTGENWSFRQLFDTIADNFNKRHPSLHANATLAAIAWRWEKVKSMFTGKRSLLSKESARIAQTRTFFSNAKLLRYLPGFTFTPIKEAIQLSCTSYKQKNIGSKAINNL
ncbi:MAG: NAD-dependent epimerase/dehydratase family protein [Chitinophagaceae bacterium]